MQKPNDKDIFDPTAIERLTREQILNYALERIEAARQNIISLPSPDSHIINSKEQERWRYRTGVLYGRAIGCIECMLAFDLINPEQFKDLKNQLLTAWNVRLTREFAGLKKE